MNLSELFIRRPVMTVLLNVAIVVAGVIAYRSIPVAALPSYDTPVINVYAALPGANPETMATSVALPLEKQFQTIPGLAVISSTSTLGSTSLTLEFDEGRNLDGAALDVQAALLRAQRSLPQDMTQLPAYRKVNPADAPVLLVALTSPSMPMSDLQDFAEHLILEHVFRWLAGIDASLWSPGFFFPFPGALAFSDNHFGTVGVYALLRLGGLSPERAYIGWFTLAYVANFLCAFHVLRRFGLGVGGPRAARNTLPCLFSLLCAIAAFATSRMGAFER